jgi:flagellar protein FlgJ
MDLATAERLASVVDANSVSALQGRRDDPAVKKAVAEQFGTLLLERVLQNGDGEALAMAGGTGGSIVNALFAKTMAETAMSGDRLGLADLLFRSIAAAAPPHAAEAPVAPAAAPLSRGFPLSPYWQMGGMRPLAGRNAPAAPSQGRRADLVARPTPPGGPALPARGAVPSAVPPPASAPMPDDDRTPSGGAIAGEGAAMTAIAAFARRLAPALQRAAEQLGVSPRILLAQAALESGWGRAAIGNNVFGIKADPFSDEAQVSAPTHEIENGHEVTERASFRAYVSLDAAVEDYVALIAGSPRYRAALGLGDDARAYGEALLRGGYATDDDYAAKLAAVAASPSLAAAMAELPQEGSPPLPERS